MKWSPIVCSAVGLLLLSTDVVSQVEGNSSSSTPRNTKCNFAHDVLHTVGEQNIHGGWQGKTMPALPVRNSWTAHTAFLYWHADVAGSTITADLEGRGYKTTEWIAFSSKWSPGVQIGLEYRSDLLDHLGLKIDWTRFHTRPTAQLIDYNYGPKPISYAGNGSLHYNSIRLELGRDCFMSRNITIRPHFSVRGDRINESFEFKTLDAPPSGYILGSTKFWGIGAGAGGDISWYLNPHWRVVGGCVGALLSGHSTAFQSVKLSQSHLLERDISTRKKGKTSEICPHIGTQIGLAWDSFAYQERCHVALKISYEFSEWFFPNDSRAEADEDWAIPLKKHLGIQGVTCKLELLF